MNWDKSRSNSNTLLVMRNRNNICNLEYCYLHAENLGIIPKLEPHSVKAPSKDQELAIFNKVYNIASYTRRRIIFTINKYNISQPSASKFDSLKRNLVYWCLKEKNFKKCYVFWCFVCSLIEFFWFKTNLVENYLLIIRFINPFQNSVDFTLFLLAIYSDVVCLQQRSNISKKNSSFLR